MLLIVLNLLIFEYLLESYNYLFSASVLEGCLASAAFQHRPLQAPAIQCVRLDLKDRQVYRVEAVSHQVTLLSTKAENHAPQRTAPSA
jgi:hypothetical protein